MIEMRRELINNHEDVDRNKETQQQQKRQANYFSSSSFHPQEMQLFDQDRTRLFFAATRR